MGSETSRVANSGRSAQKAHGLSLKGSEHEGRRHSVPAKTGTPSKGSLRKPAPAQATSLDAIDSLENSTITSDTQMASASVKEQQTSQSGGGGETNWARRWSLPGNFLRGRRRSTTPDGDHHGKKVADGVGAGSKIRGTAAHAAEPLEGLPATPSPHPSSHSVTQIGHRPDHVESGSIRRRHTEPAAQQSVHVESSVPQGLIHPDFARSTSSMGSKHTASYERLMGSRPQSPDISPCGTPVLSPSPSSHLTDTDSIASTSTSNIDELTTLVAFGVVLPSLASASSSLPLSSSPAYISRYSHNLNGPQSAPSSPKVGRASEHRNRSGTDQPRRNSVGRPLSGSFGSSAAAPGITSGHPSTITPDLTPPTPLTRTNSSASSHDTRRYSAPQPYSPSQQPQSPPRSTSPEPPPPLSPPIHPQVNSLNRPKNPDRRKSLPSRLHPPSPLHQSYSPPRAPSPEPEEDLPSTHSITLELPAFERSLRARMSPQVFLKGELIIRKHDVGKDMWFLSKGKVEVVSGDLKKRYGIIEEGSFFGELGVLFDIPRTASIRALSNCYCMRLTRVDLESAMQPFPLISERFRKVVAERMVEVQKKRDRSNGRKAGPNRLDFVPGVGRVVEVAKEEEDAP
ncbi:hypothetical protein HDV00_006038 [Rhizophlyctis rosea]|nr:hypothetical protein HDV00_006038 [Rhizophlyctis rosea]